MREKLVCYLLGELDEQQRAELEARLAAEPALRRELEQIRECLAADDHDAECPVGLADRTASRIAEVTTDAPCGRSRWSLVDVAVAAGVLLALGAMLAPALPRGRADARRLLCQDNMRQLGQGLVRYADNHADTFPYIRPNENAGMFAVRLRESGEFSQEELQRLLWCRASSLQEGSTKIIIRVPKSQELTRARGQALAMLRRWMAGSYAYRSGYVASDQLMPVSNISSSRSPLLSDAPMHAGGGWVSVNHGRDGGQNVLHQDGSVRFQVSPACGVSDGNIFVNRQGEAAAGLDPMDVVLLRSDLTPGGGRRFEPVRTVKLDGAQP